jgi:hypothetical protein
MTRTNRAAEAIREDGPLPASELPYDSITPAARLEHGLARFRITKLTTSPVWYVMGEHDEAEVVRAYVEAHPGLLDMTKKEATLAFRQAGPSWLDAWKEVRSELKRDARWECPKCGAEGHLRCACETPF